MILVEVSLKTVYIDYSIGKNYKKWFSVCVFPFELPFVEVDNYERETDLIFRKKIMRNCYK